MSGFNSWRCWWCHVALMNFPPIHSDWQLHPQVQDHHHQLVPDGQDLHRHQHAEDPHNQVEPQLKQLLDTLASRCRPNANLQADKFRRWTDPFLQILGTNLDITAPLVMIRICPSLIWMIQKSRQRLETEWQRLLNEVLVSSVRNISNQKPFCQFHTISGVCGICRKPVGMEGCTAFGKVYHKECFKCCGCKKRIDGKFFERNGKPYCEKCYSVRILQNNSDRKN